MKDDRERACQCCEDSVRFNQQSNMRNNSSSQQQDYSNDQQSSQWDSQQESQHDSQDLWQGRYYQQNRNNRSLRSHLSKKEEEYHRDNNLCFNCDYSDHFKLNYNYSFNSDQVLLKKNNDKAKTQSFWTHSYRPARTHALRAHSSTLSDYNIHTTDEFSDSEWSSKWQKN